jgi:hypothetical protein
MQKVTGRETEAVEVVWHGPLLDIHHIGYSL